ncbi:MAG: copper chaperone PCu(A)C [Acetobacteraceae bacterium]|nr:copper chaperone PCu(A)C [Acetobacteraceae bacterium]
MTRRVLLALALAPFPPLPAAAQPGIRAGDLVITQAWSRAAGQGGQGAGYLTIANRGTAPDRLLSASSPAAGRMELHSMVRDGDVMRMRQVPAIDIAPGATVELRPGGLHLMFVGLGQPLRQGETVPVTLRFERAGEVSLGFAIQAAGARGPAHHGH